MKHTRTLALIGLAVSAIITVSVNTPSTGAEAAPAVDDRSRPAAALRVTTSLAGTDTLVAERILARHDADVTVMESQRPGFSFWQHIFRVPDGAIAYGSAIDGRLLAVFPTKGDWLRDARWHDRSLVNVLDGHDLPRALDDRREYVASVLEAMTGPVLHNPTRGRFLTDNIARYGPFLNEWGATYERFGVPAHIGLAQAIIESGLDGTRRSEAAAVGFCQWLAGNWKHLDRLSPTVIEAQNQTTQAAYCGAYLAVLGTKYGSFIPALSEHHTGGTNVGRTLINGERLGGSDTRERYFLGAELARDLRILAPDRYSDIYKTYGPRSYRYAEMIFGNTFNVTDIAASTPQKSIYAMRTKRTIPLTEIMRHTGLSADQVRRFNPALVKRVPANATLYLPVYVKAFGADVAFWRQPADATFASLLNEFVRIDATPHEFDQPAFAPTLRAFQERFRNTGSEEGVVMATVLAYVMDEAATSGRREILDEFRSSADILQLFERSISERNAARMALLPQ
jgi:hypothetical protein